MSISVEPRNRLPKDGRIEYFPSFLCEEKSTTFFAKLFAETLWQEKEITIFGKKIMQPRLFSWHADPGVHYKYSGLRLQPQPWTPLLIELKGLVEQQCGEAFNSVLVNLYRDQKDSNGWHSDDEKELGATPTIASLSLGQGRDFLLKHKREALGTLKIHLQPGSLLIMKGATQTNWKHSLPKRSRFLAPRINLTFRKIIF